MIQADVTQAFLDEPPNDRWCEISEHRLNDDVVYLGNPVRFIKVTSRKFNLNVTCCELCLTLCNWGAFAEKTKSTK